MSRPHSLTSELIAREIFNPDTGGVKVEMLPMEMSIELSHADGDSVTAYKGSFSLSLAATQSGNILGSSSVTVFTEPNKTIHVAPDNSGTWYLAGTSGDNGLLVLNMAAAYIKCEAACKVVAV